MTQNLRIIGKTINASDSDITGGSFAIPNTSLNNFTTNTSNNDNFAYYLDEVNGSFYTFYASTAGSTISSGDAPNSICPKGWKLPVQTDFDLLVSRYSITTLGQNPANFITSGYIQGGQRYQYLNSDASGDYRGASNNKSSSSYYLYYSPGRNQLETYINSGGNCQLAGCTIRCLSRK